MVQKTEPQVITSPESEPVGYRVGLAPEQHAARLLGLTPELLRESVTLGQLALTTILIGKGQRRYYPISEIARILRPR